MSETYWNGLTRDDIFYQGTLTELPLLITIDILIETGCFAEKKNVVTVCKAAKLN